ncbi:MAG: hypothetical protein HKN82_09210 [Akkermansiaceae bacterium]|nr:hypothetical protein [Akkermansiaceae bacterium]NNM31377.1 hypothetical protein [Akkermansiaceae bacterium]
MAKDITNKTDVELGVVPTHFGFVGALVPEDGGKLPRNDDGQLVVVALMQDLCERSRVKIDSVQAAVFPGTDQDDFKELCEGLKALDLALYFIMMVGGADPMNPADESAIVDQLLPSLEAAKTHGVQFVSSTSIEEWMAGPPRKDGADFDAAVAQNAKLHARVHDEAGLAGSCVQGWHIEFLRPGEMKTFTDVGRLWTFVQAANEAVGSPFFKCLVDAAHCGDSQLSIPENQDLIAKIGAAGDLGCFHVSPPTTRGCITTDDGWIGALLAATARTGTLRNVFVEAFHHEDPALAALRELDPGHGIDTTDGRDYTQVVADGLAATARRLNNLKARGIL